jgi:hypothetical protein
LLIGYALSGERTLSDFFHRLAPFAAAFMALFGRAELPHRSSLSRFLARVERPCLEAFRTLFEQHSEASGWTNDSIGGIWDRQGRRSIVFDVDATRQAARQRALPTAPELPAARRRLDAECRARVQRAQARRGGPHPNHGASKAHPPMDWYVRRSWEWRFPRGIGLSPWGHHDVCQSLRSHLTSGSGSPRWTGWRCGGNRSTD